VGLFAVLVDLPGPTLLSRMLRLKKPMTACFDKVSASRLHGGPQ